MKKQSNVTVMKALLVETNFIIAYQLLTGVRKEVANTYGGRPLHYLSGFDYTLSAKLKGQIVQRQDYEI